MKRGTRNVKKNRRDRPVTFHVPRSNSRRICFVTGTRAEFGLMNSVLQRIGEDRRLSLQIIATGMHLDRSRGKSLHDIKQAGWPIDRTIPWRTSSTSQARTAIAMGNAIAGLAEAFEQMASDIVLVTGDRVEAFAAASAAHVSGRLVAHLHGGDRALGLVDDSLRHAITKLAHIHFPATVKSAQRIAKLGEDRWRIFRAGSPGLDHIRVSAAARSELAREFPTLHPRQFALLVLHPQSPIEADEAKLARAVIQQIRAVDLPGTVIIYPNNDPGSGGIVRVWESLARSPRFVIRKNISREMFLGLMRDAAVLVGNSSSGIIEAASFGTPVIDIGRRQLGRERGGNVRHVEHPGAKLRSALNQIWRNGHPRRIAGPNPYGGNGAAAKIARTLADIKLDRFRPKLIAY
jgi:GDP/UDP-N,N'-diacetylbacillosamine 2-epimerase (hydrolysing)